MVSAGGGPRRGGFFACKRDRRDAESLDRKRRNRNAGVSAHGDAAASRVGGRGE
jgi:hypothetical protein